MDVSDGVTSAPDLDPRFLLARPDLAELALEGLVRAERYAPTVERRCRLAFVPITDQAGEPVGEILHGEAFDVLETREARSWGRARRDGTVGYVDADLLDEPVRPVRRVAVADAELPLNALVGPGEDADGLADFLTFDPDPATAAERLMGAQYRRRGRSRAGVDCGGLVQQALLACGRAGPRASDLQALLGEAVRAPRRGDLAVWISSHAGVMVDADHLIHACPDAGLVTVEPLSVVDARWRSRGAPAPVFRRV